MNRRRFLAWSLGVGATVLGFPGAARASLLSCVETVRCWRVMGTLIEVRVPDLPPPDARDAIRGVRRRLESMEAAMTLFRPESPLVALNTSQPGRWMAVPALLRDGLLAARSGARVYAGLYDPTVAPLMRVLGLQDLTPRPDDPGFRKTWRSRPGAEGLEFDATNLRARRLDPRVEYDLGGVGKGMAVDAALTVLKAAGSSAALVNLGGSIGVLGPPPEEPEGWLVGIAHPRRPGTVWGTLRLAAGHVATSGDYERVVSTAAGRRHHLLDPRTGEPTRGVGSATVWSASGLRADVASTARMVQAAGGGRPVLEPSLVLGSGESPVPRLDAGFPAVEVMSRVL